MASGTSDMLDGVAAERRQLSDLVAAHVDLVYAAALRQVRDPHLADDVTQRVFLMMAEKADRLPAEPLLAGWLVKVTRYTALTALRGDRRRERHEWSAGTMAATSGDEGQNHGPVLEMLDEALMALSEADRQLLCARFLQGRSLPETATAFCLRPNTAAKRMERALLRLRDYFQRRGVTGMTSGTTAALLMESQRPAPASLKNSVALRPGKVSLKIASRAALGASIMSGKAAVAAGVVLIAVILGAGGMAIHRWQRPSTPTATTMVADDTPIDTSTGRTTVTLRGTVTDAAGKPLAHAFVGQGFSPFARDAYRSAYTDEVGRFAITRVQVSDPFDLLVIAHGYVPLRMGGGQVTATMPETAATVHVGPTEHFRFVDEHGAPLEGVVASPVLWNNKDLRTQALLKGAAGDPPWDGMISGADGKVTWDFVPPDNVSFSFYKEGEVYREEGELLKPFEGEKVITLREALKLDVKVVDDQTGAPLPAFECFFGLGETPDHVSSWDGFGIKGAEGLLHHNMTDVYKMNFVRVEAPGYAPVVQSFSDAPAQVSLTYRLSKSAGMVVKVVRPDHTPAAGAKVFLAGEGAMFDFPFEDVLKGWSSPSEPQFLKADERGECKLAAPQGAPTDLVIVDQAGFAEVPEGELKPGAEITLEPWATVEGVVHVGPKTAARMTVNLIMTLPVAGKDIPGVMLSWNTKSDKHGAYRFGFVPPREMAVARVFSAGEASGGESWVRSPEVKIAAKSGETETVALGGAPRFVTGRIVAKGAHAPDAHWRFTVGEIDPPPGPTLFTASEMAELKALSPQAAKSRWKELVTPERAAAYNKASAAWRAAHPKTPASFLVGRDGKFCADGVAAGARVLSVSVLDESGKVVGKATTALTVPTDGTETMDVGEVPVEMGK